MWWLLTVFIIQLISIFLYLVLGYRVHTRWAPEVYTLNISIVIHRMACKHTIKIRYYLFHTYQILNPLLREAVIHLFLPWQFVLFVSTITIHFLSKLSFSLPYVMVFFLILKSCSFLFLCKCISVLCCSQQQLCEKTKFARIIWYLSNVWYLQIAVSVFLSFYWYQIIIWRNIYSLLSIDC